MSVINQMLRDLDARGQGGGASRRTAMAAVGQAAGTRPAGWRSSRLWWLVAALTVALASAVVMLVAHRWKALAPVGAPPTVDAMPVDAPAPPPVPAPLVAEVSASAASEVERSEGVTAAVPASDGETPPESPVLIDASPSMADAPVAPRLADSPVEPIARPDDAAPLARTRIERVMSEIDPLDAARSALSEGRASDALTGLSDLSVHSAERNALEAAALQALGRHAEAEEAYRRALRQDPEVGAWWAGLGISLDASGRGAEALGAFREAQRRGPLDPALTDYLGERVEALSAEPPR